MGWVAPELLLAVPSPQCLNCLGSALFVYGQGNPGRRLCNLHLPTVSGSPFLLLVEGKTSPELCGVCKSRAHSQGRGEFTQAPDPEGLVTEGQRKEVVLLSRPVMFVWGWRWAGWTVGEKAAVAPSCRF